jgi:hypothetical protein
MESLFSLRTSENIPAVRQNRNEKNNFFFPIRMVFPLFSLSQNKHDSKRNASETLKKILV